jgi:hypothetical protein
MDPDNINMVLGYFLFRFQIQFTCYSQASGFCLDRRIYDKFVLKDMLCRPNLYNRANMTVHLTGNAYSWAGKSYLETPVLCAISFYHVRWLPTNYKRST